MLNRRAKADAKLRLVDRSAGASAHHEGALIALAPPLLLLLLLLQSELPAPRSSATIRNKVEYQGSE